MGRRVRCPFESLVITFRISPFESVYRSSIVARCHRFRGVWSSAISFTLRITRQISFEFFRCNFWVSHNPFQPWCFHKIKWKQNLRVSEKGFKKLLSCTEFSDSVFIMICFSISAKVHFPGCNCKAEASVWRGTKTVLLVIGIKKFGILETLVATKMGFKVKKECFFTILIVIQRLNSCPHIPGCRPIYPVAEPGTSPENRPASGCRLPGNRHPPYPGHHHFKIKLNFLTFLFNFLLTQNQLGIDFSWIQVPFFTSKWPPTL